MCGFAGFLSFERMRFDAETRRGILQDMGQVLARRGPDDEQLYDDGCLSLVFRRLSVVGHACGRQPLTGHNGQHVLVCNGEVFNHAELRASLAAQHRFATQSDCEVLVHGIGDAGPAFLQHVQGMFALAFWDRSRRQLILARDRLGIKPLYYALLPDGILFGSELKALLVHPQCPRSVDLSAYGASWLTPQPTPSFVRGVHQLGGGECLVLQPDRPPRTQRYWDLAQHLGTAPWGNQPQAYQEQLRSLLLDSVRQQIVGPQMGLHLSGGTDSTLLAACAAREGRSLPCFTFVERTTLLCGDVTAARQAANALGHSWYPVHFDYRDLWDRLEFDLPALERLVWMMDSPQFDLEWLLKWALTAAAKNQIPDLKVLLLGQGADEFAGGYSKRIDTPFANWDAYLQIEVEPTLAQYPAPGGRAPTSSLSTYHRYMLLFGHQLQAFNLWHEDRTSSWHGVEARVPFLDHRIVELLASVPASLQAELFWNKRIYRNLLGDMFAEFDAQRVKTGFHVTNDTRSIQLLTHDLAQRLAPEFLHSYVLQDDFPLDRAAIQASITSVLQRRPGFFIESIRLLQAMCTAIFVRNLQPGAHASFTAFVQAPHAGLDLITNSKWSGLTEDYARQPVIPVLWHTDDRISVRHDANVRYQLDIDGHRWTLSLQDGTGESMTIGGGGAWFGDFWRRLSSYPGQSLRLGFLVATLETTLDELTEVLNVLHQCGFILRQQASPRPAAESTHARVMRLINQLVRGRTPASTP